MGEENLILKWKENNCMTCTAAASMSFKPLYAIFVQKVLRNDPIF